MLETINTEAILLFEEFKEQFTLEQLSQKTKISRATLYRRIGSKDALLKQLSEQGLIKFDEQSDIKSRIFKATRTVVGEYGFINCTMEQIAKEAGLGVATLYRHFSEKEKLLHAFTSELNSQLNISSVTKKPQGKFEDSLSLLVENLLYFISENVDLVQLMFFSVPMERKYINTIRNSSVSTFSAISDYFKTFQKQGEISRHTNTEDMATGLVGLILHYAITSPLHFNRTLDIKKDTKIIVQLFCKGVTPTKKRATK